MKVEILYFPGCPNHPPAVGAVLEALQAERVTADLVEIEVKDAAAAHVAGFLGSPTIRIDGQDVERSARSVRAFGLSCRTYTDQGRRAGVPPLEWIRAGLREAMTCAACARGLEASFRKMAGVEKVAVDYKAGQAVITFDPGKQSVDSISKFVADCGYEVKETKVI